MNGLSSERGDLIVAGLAVVKRLFDRVRASNLIVSGCGVREGLFFRHYLRDEYLPDVISDILGHSTINMLRFYKVNEQHAQHVTDMTLQLFDGWTELHQMDDRDRRLLKSAALLHDIGISINQNRCDAEYFYLFCKILDRVIVIILGAAGHGSGDQE
jgi:exopolyphosphatase/guanosine-5'-triphosphate,3'-diphosphate pyrophosphatase